MNIMSPAGPAALQALSVQHDLDTEFSILMSQAKALASSPTPMAALHEFIADVALSGQPDAALKCLADAAGKNPFLEAKAVLTHIRKARRKFLPQGDAAGTSLVKDPMPHANPDPLDKIAEIILRVILARVFCTEQAAWAVVLWIIGTWGLFPPSDPLSGPDLYPRLHIFSPAKRCGKSTLLETVNSFVRRAIAATDVSESAIFRLVGRYSPTLVIDEADRLFAKVRDLVGIANSGYTRSGSVIRSIEMVVNGAKTYEPMAFSTFCAMALCGIGNLASTIADRSIRVVMQRQANGRNRKRIGLQNLAKMRDLVAPMLMAHADDIGAAMAKGVPDSTIPAGLNDRDADNWGPLFGLADHIGGAWPSRIRQSATALCAVSADGDGGPEWELRQIVEAVDAARLEAVEGWRTWVKGGRKTAASLPGLPGAQRHTVCRFVSSDKIALWLFQKDDSGFSDQRDVGVVKLKVARRLKLFGVSPGVRKINGQAVRGYDAVSIKFAWRRYQP